MVTTYPIQAIKPMQDIVAHPKRSGCNSKVQSWRLSMPFQHSPVSLAALQPCLNNLFTRMICCYNLASVQPSRQRAHPIQRILKSCSHTPETDCMSHRNAFAQLQQHVVYVALTIGLVFPPHQEELAVLLPNQQRKKRLGELCAIML